MREAESMSASFGVSRLRQLIRRYVGVILGS